MNHWRSQGGNKKMPRDKWKWKQDNPKQCSKSSSVYSNTNLPQEMRKISNKQPNPTPKLIRKRTNTKQS